MRGAEERKPLLTAGGKGCESARSEGVSILGAMTRGWGE